jgi:hypothetical protein
MKTSKQKSDFVSPTKQQVDEDVTDIDDKQIISEHDNLATKLSRGVFNSTTNVVKVETSPKVAPMKRSSTSTNNGL